MTLELVIDEGQYQKIKLNPVALYYFVGKKMWIAFFDDKDGMAMVARAHMGMKQHGIVRRVRTSRVFKSSARAYRPCCPTSDHLCRLPIPSVTVVFSQSPIESQAVLRSLTLRKFWQEN
jgi:hypothetical protein